MDLALYQPSGAYNFEMFPTFLENFYRDAVKNCTGCEGKTP
jgi:hypothetical protein